MTESRDTKKFHPSPAKNEKKSSSSPQTDGSNRNLADTEKSHPGSEVVDVIQEQKKTEKGYESMKKK